MKRTAVIMAGGSGERFWPLSRKHKPKQLLSLISDKTLIEESIERIVKLIPPDDIFIITGEHLLKPMRDALPQIPPENIVAEPFKRNTAPCLALSAAFIAERYAGQYKPDEISVAVLTADQIIHPADGFRDTIKAALEYVENWKVIGIIGIQPSRPETGYGYIEVENSFLAAGKVPEIKQVLQFHEKPFHEKALEYVQSGKFLWNSGMFFWRLDIFIQNMEIHLEEVGLKIGAMRQCFKDNTRKALDTANEQVSSIFEAFPDISIDYGIMEKTRDAVVVRALFDWDDVGSWDALERVGKIDDSNNIIDGNATTVETKDCIIINKSKISETKVACYGMENIVIVVTDDAILVCPKDRVQGVKKCVEKIRSERGEQWL